MFNIQEAISTELFKPKPDTLHLRVIEQLKESGILTLKQFSSTGRFVGADTFTKENPDVSLHSSCTDVVYYVGGFYVQALKDNTFFADLCGHKIVNKSLDEIEVIIWDIFLDNFFNNQK